MKKFCADNFVYILTITTVIFVFLIIWFSSIMKPIEVIVWMSFGTFAINVLFLSALMLHTWLSDQLKITSRTQHNDQ